MSKTLKTILAGSVLAASTLASGTAMAELSANVAATSNYIWRGVTQTGDGAAVSGGIDYSNESGIYAGLWNSNTAGNAETDLYVGFSGEAAGIGYDVGYIAYRYNDATPTNDFSEIYVGASYQQFSAKYSMSSDLLDSTEDSTYLEVGADFPAGDMTVGVHFGSYDFKDDLLTDYTDYSVSLSKDEFSIAYSATSEDAIWNGTDNGRIAVTWSKGFGL